MSANQGRADGHRLQKQVCFAGVNNAGPGSASIAIADAIVKMKVKGIIDLSGTVYDATPLFEDQITAAGFIKQLFVGDLSAKKYALTLE